MAIGKDWESRITNCLINHYNYNLQESSFNEDCKEKTDRWYVTKSGKKLRCAVKVRLDKNGNIEQKKKDILIALRDPYYGVTNEKTVIGRDVLFEYFMYISMADGQIRVVNGKSIKNITNLLWQEFLEKHSKFVPASTGFGGKLILQSEKVQNCQIWLHHDSRSRHPKLLAFVPPHIFETSKEIKYHKFIEE